MGRKTKMTEDVKTVITKIHARHPDWSARVIAKKIPEFNRTLIGKAPGKSKVSEFIGTLSTIDLDDDDKPWSIGTLNKYPYLKSVLRQLLILKNIQFKPTYEKFTVRWALWFYRLEKLYYPADVSQAMKYFGDIIILTSMYSDYEKQWVKAGLNLPANTSKFDDLDIEIVKQNFLNWYKDDLEPDTYDNLTVQMSELSKLYGKEPENDK